MQTLTKLILAICALFLGSLQKVESSQIKLGIDQVFTKKYEGLLRGKKVGLITNHTGINSQFQSSIHSFKQHAVQGGYTLQALFAPEHGITGGSYAAENIEHLVDVDGIPIYSLYGKTHRPTKAMLKNIDVLVYDIQDIGSRSYTYMTTLFYVMEEAAKMNISVVVLDRPNPINGLTVDGPILQPAWRSIVGYINVPYCHGMTIGELALYFNQEYQIGCPLTIVPMQGWKREMSFQDTGCSWIPTSPNIPEASTTLYYPTTGILGELQIVNIGIGYTLPFKLIGAPWICAEEFAKHLNDQHFPGVHFYPFYYRPFYGRFCKQDCQGVLISITDPTNYLPVSTQYLLIGMLKSLYPKAFQQALDEKSDRINMFNKVNGTDEVYRILKEEKYVIWKLKELHQKERGAYLAKRQKYLIY